ncbi:sulfurtransferase [Peribacillus glennii]|uniref:Sulfurtransferase n=1 Tax=Peribacillus glennii TaxID=2303991 RepID=A0A372LIB1_9BACI|nr:sulfurtransferase [Peribacillus glennii]
MILALLIFSILAVFWFLYTRHYPVKNIPCIKNEHFIRDDDTILLDIRDYNDSRSDSDKISMNIPYAYLRRFKSEIADGNIHVIAADKLELNLGLRFLMRKGFNITSYEIIDCPCKE